MDVHNKKVVVLGAARSGLAAARMLKRKGADVFVSDLAPESSKKEIARQLHEADIPCEFGQHSGRVFQSDLAILSPGIPYASSLVQNLLKMDIPVYSEIEAAWWFNASPVIGVTGSNGKTTTTSLIGAMLRKNDPRAIVAGNIGTPFSDYVDQSAPGRWAVVELSSFQLETIDAFRPSAAVLLNFAPNHLNRYESYAAYQDAKWRITKNMQADDLLVYNGDDSLLSQRAAVFSARKAAFSLNKKAEARLENETLYVHDTELLRVGEIALKGRHNVMNAMAAALAAREAGVDIKDIIEVLKTFKGLEHRLEHVRLLDGVNYVNDSKATTVESLYWALQSFKEPVVLIAGGQDKGSDFSRLNSLLARNVRQAVLIGSAAEKMRHAWQGVVAVQHADSMEDAVKKARKAAHKGDVVLLSPACASFDMFDDYEARGRIFKQIVKGL